MEECKMFGNGRGGEFRITELASNTAAERHLLYELVPCSPRAFVKQQHAAIRSHGKSVGSWPELTNHLGTANHSLSQQVTSDAFTNSC